MRRRWLFLPVLLVVAAGPGLARADDACVAEVEALRAEIADDSRLIAKARGDLVQAMTLCRAGKIDEARAISQAVRDRAGMSMGQGQ